MHRESGLINSSPQLISPCKDLEVVGSSFDDRLHIAKINPYLHEFIRILDSAKILPLFQKKLLI